MRVNRRITFKKFMQFGHLKVIKLKQGSKVNIVRVLKKIRGILFKILNFNSKNFNKTFFFFFIT